MDIVPRYSPTSPLVHGILLLTMTTGQDNSSSQCIAGSANLLKNNETDHDGPYDGVEMGC